MSEIPTGAAEALPTPPEGEDNDVVGTAQESSGGFSTFKGDFDEGVVDVTCVDLIGTRMPKYQSTELEDKLVFLFAIAGKESQGNVALIRTPKLGEKANLPKDAKALGVTLAAGDPIRKSAFVGKKCKAILEAKTSKDGSSTYPKITKLVKG